MKTYTKAIATVVICSLFLISCSDSSRLKDALEKYVETENKTYPTKIDDYTRLDSCKYIEPSTLRYIYTTNIPNEAITDSTIIKEALKKNILGQSKIEANSKYFREKGVTFQYEYQNTEGYLFRIDITAEDYKQK